MSEEVEVEVEVEVETKEAEKIFEEIKKGNWKRFLEFDMLYNKDYYHSMVLSIVFSQLIGDVLAYADSKAMEYVVAEKDRYGIFPLFDGKGFINFEKAKEFADQYSEFIRAKSAENDFYYPFISSELGKEMIIIRKEVLFSHKIGEQ